jgi:hypothetical protein
LASNPVACVVAVWLHKLLQVLAAAGGGSGDVWLTQRDSSVVSRRDATLTDFCGTAAAHLHTQVYAV